MLRSEPSLVGYRKRRVSARCCEGRAIIATRTYLIIPRVRDNAYLGAVLDVDRRCVLHVHQAIDGDEMRPKRLWPSGSTSKRAALEANGIHKWPSDTRCTVRFGVDACVGNYEIGSSARATAAGGKCDYNGRTLSPSSFSSAPRRLLLSLAPLMP